MTASPTSKQIAIVGAGICGLCTALGLAKQGHQVTVYERDDPLPDGGPDEIFFEWLRRGASQFRHPHAFLAAMSNLLTEQFPDLIEDFWQAGARKVPFQEMLPPELSQSYTPAPEDEALWLMMCRRATMEMVLRRYALQQPNLTIASGIRVNAMVTEMIGAQMQITGLTIQARAASEEPLNVKADIVIDAAGRGSPFKRWFQQKGLVIKTESHDAGIVYYTRHYQFKPGFDEPKRDGKTRSAGDLGYLKYGVFPGSGGHFAVILCVPCIDTALHDAVKDDATFDQICLAIPGLQPWLGADQAVATTSSFGMGNIKAVWHDFSQDEQPLLLNYYAVGDASVRTNPLYGRGCSTGAIHSKILTDILSRDQDPASAAKQFAEETRKQLRPIWQASLDEDRTGIKRAQTILSPSNASAAPTLKKRFAIAYGDALTRATQIHLRVFRGAFRTFNLMELPGAFLKDIGTQALIFWTLIRYGAENKKARVVPGPDRDEMIAALAPEATQRAA
ncbi:MAG: FAD-dependent oxidoreductase [Proteobacteria bacterium]|nr:FAD-dependent oxidoreductase [Pseudomonadota bacterium]